MKKVLFIPSPVYLERSWPTRINYIYPDILQAMRKQYRVSLVTQTVPDFAHPALERFCNNFSIELIEIKQISKYGATRDEAWMNAVAEIALEIQPDVITNVLSSLRLGKIMTYAAHQSKSRAVVRVAGDEIGVRITVGSYENSPSKYAAECDQELTGFLGAHAIIAMSPWERKRIRTVLTSDAQKVQVCIRGVDLMRFAPHPGKPPRNGGLRILFTGRAAGEKGYHLVEEAAKIVYEINPQIEFLFAGSFEPNLIENRRYLGWVEASDLPELYQRADAFILTSYTEGFPQVVAEAMASGLPCILTKSLFSSIFSHIDDALLVDLNVNDIVEAVLLLSKDKELFDYLCSQSRNIAIENFDKSYWQNRYLEILDGKQNKGNTILDREMPIKNLPVQELFERKRSYPLKVLFISPRPLDTLGPRSSYLFAEELNRHVNLLIVNNCQATDAAHVYTLDKDLRVIDVDFSLTDYMETIADVVKAFSPDIVFMTNAPIWYNLIPYLKSAFSQAKYVLDMRSPFLGDAIRGDTIRKRGKIESAKLDLITSRNSEDIATWIDNNKAPVMIYPLGIPVDMMKPKDVASMQPVHCRRFVYIGTLDKKRQLQNLVRLIAALPDKILKDFSLDMYGYGDDKEALQELCQELNLGEKIQILGALHQEELFSRLADYDAGIAWVPRALYSAAPSLKFLEFAGAGLVVLATNTIAHKRNIADGFEAILFSENSASFTKAMEEAMLVGYSAEKIVKNLETIKKNSWDAVVTNYFLPAFDKLIQSEPESAWRKQTLLLREMCNEPFLPGDELEYERMLHALRMPNTILF